nr:hypothetical protein [uncultured Carboxylicivirga sp.]
MKQTILLALLLVSQTGFSQIKNLYPTYVHPLDFSDKAKAEWVIRDSLLEQIAKGKIDWDSLSQNEKTTLEKHGEVYENIWDIIGEGCSWYCGGGPKDVTASSYLLSQGDNDYKPGNAHDLDYKSAWVEGVEGYGIGEYLIYTFEHNSPRITNVIVVNGYVKSSTAWKNNSRVKKLKMYIDDKPYAILNLRDQIGSQYFKVDTLGYGYSEEKGEPDWTIKFEIEDVYKGDKYDDTVISEIYFDGVDVHCFVKGTKVLMGDQSSQNIEDLQIGDEVVTIDEITGKEIKAIVRSLEKVIHDNLVTYQFESGRKITATKDHPFKIYNKGWASLAPDQSKQYKGFEQVETIKIGDVFMTLEGTDQLIAITASNKTQVTYTISALDKGKCFVANGLLVGVETLKGK